MIFIYVLKCPLTSRPRYVGKTQNPDTRLAKHISKAASGQTNHHCANWIRQLLDQGLMPVFEIVFEVPPDEEWQIYEKRVISNYLSDGHELTNLTGGGGGFYKANPELLARRGASISRARLEPEYNKKIRDIAKEAQSRQTTKAAKSESMKAVWIKRRESFVAGMNTDEARHRRAEATRRRYADPDFALKDSEQKRLRFAEPEKREQLRQASLKRWADYRARKQEAL